MLIQLHWQNRANHEQTEMVAQAGPFCEPAEMHAWANEVIARRVSEMPDGWCPMVCTEDSEYFWKAPKQ